MGSFQHFMDSQLEKGRSTFIHEQALRELKVTPQAFQAALSRMRNKGRVVSPKRGFSLILRPEDRVQAPEPARWIDPLMRHLGLDYRISLWRAAAFHGSSHQAAMVFQVVTTRQLSNIRVGRQQVEFLYQSSPNFQAVNRTEWLEQLKTDSGYAKVAGVELTLLDAVRYFHRSGGIQTVAQFISDLGRKADPRILASAANHYENSVGRRLGYLLERFGHSRQALALQKFAKKAKSFKDMDPAAKPLHESLRESQVRCSKWKLVINTELEVDD